MIRKITLLILFIFFFLKFSNLFFIILFSILMIRLKYINLDNRFSKLLIRLEVIVLLSIFWLILKNSNLFFSFLILVSIFIIRAREARVGLALLVFLRRKWGKELKILNYIWWCS